MLRIAGTFINNFFSIAEKNQEHTYAAAVTSQTFGCLNQTPYL